MLLRARFIRYFSSAKSGPVISNSRLRNVGIIAHIDAGKTTTTERMLYFSDSTKRIGEVDDGATTMDFLQQERERGITINSACITFFWEPRSWLTTNVIDKDANKSRKYQVNLIDTPGHVDFTIEVERSLLALDGAVLVLDGVKGVEPQTVKVFSQAQKYSIPCIGFVNKMDRVGASMSRAAKSVEKHLSNDKPASGPILKVKCLKLQSPVYMDQLKTYMNDDEMGSLDKLMHVGSLKTDIPDDENFTGVIDLLSSKLIIFDQSKMPIDAIENVAKQIVFSKDLPKLPEEAKTDRETLAETLADFDDSFAEKFLETEDAASFSEDDLRSALKRVMLKQLQLPTKDEQVRQIVIPLLCGASFKNIGVQLLLDAIIDCLPPPHVETALRKRFGQKANENEFIARVFKIQHDQQRGFLSFARLLFGQVNVKAHGSPKGNIAYTLETDRSPVLLQQERIGAVLRVNAKDYEILTDKSVGEGEIVILSGLKHAKTGHIVTSFTPAELSKEDVKFMLSAVPEIKFPQSVFSSAILTKRKEDEKKLLSSLDILVKDDPSLSYFRDEELSQIVVSGMGELHLEVVARKLLDDYKVNCEQGDLRVAYRETIFEPFERSFDIGLHIFLKNKQNEVDEDDPTEEVSEFVRLAFRFEPIKEDEATGKADIIFPVNTADGKISIKTGETSQTTLTTEQEHVIRSTVAHAAMKGPLEGAPWLGVKITCLTDQWQFPPTLKSSMLEKCVSQYFKRLYRHEVPAALDTTLSKRVAAASLSHFCVLEPMGILTVEVPEQYFGDVIGNIGSSLLGAEVLDVQATNTGKLITARVYLSSVLKYSTTLRSLTKGEANFQIIFEKYGKRL